MHWQHLEAYVRSVCVYSQRCVGVYRWCLHHFHTTVTFVAPVRVELRTDLWYWYVFGQVWTCLYLFKVRSWPCYARFSEITVKVPKRYVHSQLDVYVLYLPWENTVYSCKESKVLQDFLRSFIVFFGHWLLFHSFSVLFLWSTIFRCLSRNLTLTDESFNHKKRHLTHGMNQCCIYT